MTNGTSDERPAVDIGTPAAAATTTEESDFARLLSRKVLPADATAKQEEHIAASLQAFAKAALDSKDVLAKGNVNEAIRMLIAQIDRDVGTQLDKILHEPTFQKLEGSWRGLKHLVDHTASSEMLQIKLMNVSKAELHKMFQNYEGTAWDQSPLFKRIYESEYGTLGGEPFGCLIGDYEFSHKGADMKVLKGVAQIAAAAHAPFIASPSPALFNMPTWQDINDPVDLTAKTLGPEHAEWRSFREDENARYVALAMPRFQARRPYSVEDNPAEELKYEEEAKGGGHHQYTWANSAYAMGANITQAFEAFGWCTQIRGLESGGIVEGLPTHTFATDDGGVDMKCPTEVSIPERRDAELSKNGLMALIHSKNSDYAAFIGGDTLHKPPAYMDAAATGNARLGARLPYVFAVSRFSHYLKVMVRAKIGQFKSPQAMQTYLHNWLIAYVEKDPDRAAPEALAKKPLSAAEVLVLANPENPGYYTAKISIKPHYQFEGMTAQLSLVTQLPSERPQA